jgi:hypothetical protein
VLTWIVTDCDEELGGQDDDDDNDDHHDGADDEIDQEDGQASRGHESLDDRTVPEVQSADDMELLETQGVHSRQDAPRLRRQTRSIRRDDYAYSSFGVLDQVMDRQCAVMLSHIPVTRLVIPIPFPREDPLPHSRKIHGRIHKWVQDRIFRRAGVSVVRVVR